ncbi:MAG TPA: DUF5657 family protein [Candidatus Saccharimonadales bacterium]|nr:DUF5657 family protein [Candidatus Saccharimonadales bacterium]
MNLSEFTFLQNHAVVFLFKTGFLTVLVLFFFFLLIVIKQIRSMNTIVTQPDLFPYLEIFSFFLVTVTILLSITTLLIL